MARGAPFYDEARRLADLAAIDVPNLDGAVVERADGIYMDKACPEHGQFGTLIWAGNEREYLRWLALSRLFLDNVPNVQASWAWIGAKPLPEGDSEPWFGGSTDLVARRVASDLHGGARQP